MTRHYRAKIIPTRHRRPGGQPCLLQPEVSVPDLGDFTDVPVIEIHVAAGDVVSEEDPLITLESDKAAMDIPSPAAGTVRQLCVEVGDRVEKGSLILLLDPVAHRPSRRH